MWKDLFSFKYTLRVRWSEIDGQRVVFNGNYLDYMDTAMVEYFRSLGLNMLKSGKTDEFDYVVAHLEMDFNASAVFDDQLDIYTRICRLGNSSFDVEFKIARYEEEEILITSKITYVVFNNHERRSQPIPEDIRKKILLRENLN